MIAVDTSALVAIISMNRKRTPAFRKLEAEDHLLISAGTVAEALIVAAHRNVSGEMALLSTD